MPLQHSSSQAAFTSNLKAELAAGKPRNQSLAIAYAVKRRAGRKSGGRTGYDLGGFINPAAAPVTGPTMPQMGMPAPAPTTPMTAPTPAGPTLGPMQMTPAAPMPPPPPAPLGGFGGMPAQTQGGLGGFGGLPFTGQNDMPNQGVLGGAPFSGAGSGNMGGGLGMGMNAGGSAGYAGGGAPQMPWFSKSESRGMMHTGPISSIVPGRTDHIPTRVASGSYILPADHVSSLGQGNTAAGHAVINHMFNSGPYGAGAMKMGHGPGAPRPPKLMGARAAGGDTGGARGHGVGTPTEVIVAGGEHSLSPEQVMRVGGGSLERGHAALDAWVKSNRQKHIKTLRKLPPPAKS